MSGPVSRKQRRQAAALAGVIGGAVAVVLVALTARGAARVCVRALRIFGGAVWFCYAAATLQLLRRCPDCRKLIRRECRVCRHCGWRRSAGVRRCGRRRSSGVRL